MLLLIVVNVYCMLVTTLPCSKRLPCILTSSVKPKTEAINWRIYFKACCTYQLRKNYFNGKPGYYWLLLWVVTMYSRLVTTSYCCKRLLCILLTYCMPKTEATNWRLVLSVLHIHGQEKFLQWETRLLQSTVVSGYYNALLKEVTMYS
jgi:hypothetical protein